MWSAAEVALYEDAAIYALVLVALSAVLTWFLVVRPALWSGDRPAVGPDPPVEPVPVPAEPVAG